MTDTEKSISNIKQRGNKFFTDNKNASLNEFNKLKQSFVDYAKQVNSLYAFSELEQFQQFDSNPTNDVPELIRIGNITALDLSNKSINNEIPVLLPFSKNNATAFFLNGKNSDSIHNLFQTIAMRFMLSLPINLAKYHLIDVNFGRHFSLLSNIKDELINKKVFAKTNEILQTINDLHDLVINANQNFLGKYSNLMEYNQKAGLMAQPYSFVFIANFPSGFSYDSAETLFNLVKDKNATRAGIYIFLSYDKTATVPHNFDINKFFQLTTNVYEDSNNLCKIDNLNFLNQNNANFTISLDTKLPSNTNQIVTHLNNQKPAVVKMTFEKKLDSLITNNQIWYSDASWGFKVPVGFVNPQEIHFFKFDQENENDKIDSDDYHALIGGITGTGKTILLHNIIINSSMVYSPFALNFYLIDCKNGTSFKPYENLPHTKVISISNDREYGRSILENIEKEMINRDKLFKSVGATKLGKYNSVAKQKLPRIICIIDEFQELINKVDMLSTFLEKLLEKILAQGRSYGINLILCTQGIGKITIDKTNLRRRYALNLTKIESDNIIGNEAAASLTGKGKAIMNNTQDGNKNANTSFQVAYIDDNKKIHEYINYLNSKFEKDYPNIKLEKQISDGEIVGKVHRNQLLLSQIQTDNFAQNDKFCDIFVGEPAFVRKQHSFFRIRKQSKSNVLIVGNDIHSAVSLIGLSLFQLIKQSSTKSKFYLLDLFNIDNAYNGKLDIVKKLSNNVKIGNLNNVTDYIQEIETELNNRIESQKNGIVIEGRIIFTIVYFKNCDDFAKQKDFLNPQPLPKEQLFAILKKGPDYGIHSIIYCINHSELMEVFEFNTVNDFENRIALFEGESMKILKDDSGSYPKDKGLAILQAPEGFTTYSADLFKVYSELQSNNANQNNNISFLKQLFHNLTN